MLAASKSAAAATNRVKLVRVATFHAPTYLAAAPGDTQRLFNAMSSFGEDTAGHVYAVSLADPVYRIAGR